MSTETYLPGFEPKAPKQKLEVHEHCFISGPRRGRFGTGWPVDQRSDFEHSHEGGDVPHQHEDTGPASYTIDKDEWFARTGLTGGGRKEFTSKPKGVQLPIRDLEEWQKSFEVVMFDPPSFPPGWGDEEGGGHVAMETMLQKHRMTATLRVVKR